MEHKREMEDWIQNFDYLALRFCTSGCWGWGEEGVVRGGGYNLLQFLTTLPSLVMFQRKTALILAGRSGTDVTCLAISSNTAVLCNLLSPAAGCK